MPTDVLPLQDLALQIRQQEAELVKLRKAFDARQTQLANLARRKEALQAQLQMVEARIQTLGDFSAEKQATGVKKTVNKKPMASKSPASKKRKRVSLAQYLINCVRDAKGPITSKELADEAVRSKYPTTSGNLRAIIDTRVGELVRKGVFRRAGDQSGVVLGNAPAAPKLAATKVPPGEHKNGHVKTKKAPTAALVVGEKKRSLQEEITQVLAKSAGPLKAADLAKEVLANGYQTKSKDFRNVIWVALGNMKATVKGVPGKGFQLKKSKS